MINNIVLIVYGLFLILGGLMGFKKGSKVSLIVGTLSGAFVFIGVWLLSFDPKIAWILLTCLNFILSVSFISRVTKTRKFMPSGMLLLITLGVLVFCLVHLSAHA